MTDHLARPDADIAVAPLAKLVLSPDLDCMGSIVRPLIPIKVLPQRVGRVVIFYLDKLTETVSEDPTQVNVTLNFTPCL